MSPFGRASASSTRIGQSATPTRTVSSVSVKPPRLSAVRKPKILIGWTRANRRRSWTIVRQVCETSEAEWRVLTSHYARSPCRSCSSRYSTDCSKPSFKNSYGSKGRLSGMSRHSIGLVRDNPVRIQSRPPLDPYHILRLLASSFNAPSAQLRTPAPRYGLPPASHCRA